jgi:predicted DNA-binding ribbon-helix-helix protein
LSSLAKRSVLLSGHATSVALEPEFWAVLDAISHDLGLTRSALLIRIDAWRGRRPLASACRVLALQWSGGDRSFAEVQADDIA